MQASCRQWGRTQRAGGGRGKREVEREGGQALSAQRLPPRCVYPWGLGCLGATA